MFIGSPGKGSKTGILTSIVFHKIPTVEFDFAAISITVCGGRECKFYHYTLQHSFSFVFIKRNEYLPDDPYWDHKNVPSIEWLLTFHNQMCLNKYFFELIATKKMIHTNKCYFLTYEEKIIQI
jgi:hypothetical protein